MTVRYHQRRGRLLPTYVCQRDGIENARPSCQAVPGGGLDQRIGQLLTGTLTPLAIEAALTVQAELQHRADDDARMEFQGGGVRMDLDNCHLAVVLIDVLVECDRPWLIRTA